MLVAILMLCVQLSLQAEREYNFLGRPCKVNHCDDEHVCVRRKDIDLHYRCVPKHYLKRHPEKIAQWNLNPSLMDELVDVTKCHSCLAEPLNYVCGTDGRVYRSPCYVTYFNCLLDTEIQIACHQECPCNVPPSIVRVTEDIDVKVAPDSDPLADDSPRDPRGYFDQCSRSVHRELRNRFFDWFHQIEKLEHRSDYRASMDDCHPAVAYMFYHFDITNDSQLNDDELNGIEHLQNESCTDAFFQRCDRDNDHRLFADEWCECFRHALLPCELHNRDFDRAYWNRSIEGVSRPQCQPNGYYAARQCNTGTPRQCWCVDKHGIEREGTRHDDDHMPQCDEMEDPFDVDEID